MTNSLFTYLILGAGRQGTAAAYDLARFGQARRIIVADADVQRSHNSSERVNALVGSSMIEPRHVQVTQEDELTNLMRQADVTLSAVPYRFNLAITRAAIASGTHLCDMGGHTETVSAQMQMNDQASQARVSIVPDCGMGPGLVNTLGAFVIELLDQAQEVMIYDAGLPQKPQPPWNYEMTFHINGLTNEMDGQAVFIRDGEICYVDTLSEKEPIFFPPIGWLEADITSGGTSLAPWTYQGKLNRYENKVMRYPGHFEWLKAFKTLGLFSEKPILVDNVEVIPRHFYHTLLEPKISSNQIHDICIMRAVGKGIKNGHNSSVTVDLIDTYDPTTGFTGMERLTGWHCSIMMIFQALGKVAPGVVPVENAVPASSFMDEIARRGIKYQILWNPAERA
jgi:lysine 6-dehydrogenase